MPHFVRGTRQLSRQAFVRGALGVFAAGALLGACRSEPAPQTQTSPVAPGPHDWNALDAAIEGNVVMPSSAEFATVKSLFNSRFDNSAPAAVVAVKSSGDVQKAMAFAANGGMKVAARSGGHSYIGASAADNAMVIDLRQLPGGITYDERRGLVTVSAATALDSVQTALAPHARSIPSGSCPTVGIAGLTLGGGLGADTRRLGLTCDALVSASVMLPSGESVTAAPDDHGDLFWALRGGGGGNFGVVTSFTFTTSPTADRDVVTLAFPERVADQVIFGWHGWLRAADRAIWGLVNITVDSGSRSCTVVLATPSGDGPNRARELSAAIGVQPVDTTVRTLGHLDFVHYFAGGTQAARPRAFVAGSDIVGDMTRSAAESIAAATSRWPHDVGSASAIVESLDGAVGDIDPGATAFPWRRQAASIQWYTEPSSPAAVDAANTWLSDAHEAVRANSAGGYVNYVELDTPPARYFGDNLGRLAAVRQKYDPDAVMQSGIGY